MAVSNFIEKYLQAFLAVAEDASRPQDEHEETVHPDNRPDIFFSHPRWLFKRWNKQFRLEAAIQLMKWQPQA